MHEPSWFTKIIVTATIALRLNTSTLKHFLVRYWQNNLWYFRSLYSFLIFFPASSVRNTSFLRAVFSLTLHTRWNGKQDWRTGAEHQRLENWVGRRRTSQKAWGIKNIWWFSLRFPYIPSDWSEKLRTNLY